MTEPGKEWDQALMQYQQGLSNQPVWGYGGNDFHCDYSAGTDIRIGPNHLSGAFPNPSSNPRRNEKRQDVFGPATG